MNTLNSTPEAQPHLGQKALNIIGKGLQATKLTGKAVVDTTRTVASSVNAISAATILGVVDHNITSVLPQNLTRDVIDAGEAVLSYPLAGANWVAETALNYGKDAAEAEVPAIGLLEYLPSIGPYLSDYAIKLMTTPQGLEDTKTLGAAIALFLISQTIDTGMAIVGGTRSGIDRVLGIGAGALLTAYGITETAEHLEAANCMLNTIFIGDSVDTTAACANIPEYTKDPNGLSVWEGAKKGFDEVRGAWGLATAGITLGAGALTLRDLYKYLDGHEKMSLLAQALVGLGRRVGRGATSLKNVTTNYGGKVINQRRKLLSSASQSETGKE